MWVFHALLTLSLVVSVLCLLYYNHFFTLSIITLVETTSLQHSGCFSSFFVGRGRCTFFIAFFSCKYSTHQVENTLNSFSSNRNSKSLWIDYKTTIKNDKARAKKKVRELSVRYTPLLCVRKIINAQKLRLLHW